MMASIDSFELPLTQPLATARGTIDYRTGFLVEIEADGCQGLGESTPLPGWTESRDECRAALEAAVQSLDDRAQALAAVADRPAARCGLTLALADLDARRTGIPLHEFMARQGDASPRVLQVNATVSDGSIDETVDAARSVCREGFDCVKIKVGARSPDTDAERLRAVVEELPADLTLRVDANGAWSLEEARRFLGSCPGLEFVEQPLQPDDLSAHASLRPETSIALDETLIERSVSEILEADAADVLVLKPMVLGGLDRAQRIASTAATAGVESLVTSTIDGVVARTGAIHLAATIDSDRACGLATADLLQRDLGPDPAPVDAGSVTVPTGPGLGVKVTV